MTTAKPRTIDVTIPADAWRDVTRDYYPDPENEPAPERACLLATFYIGAEGGWRTGFHVEAFLAVPDPEEAYDPIYYGIGTDRLDCLLAAWECGTPETTTIDGREYLIVIAPFD